MSDPAVDIAGWVCVTAALAWLVWTAIRNVLHVIDDKRAKEARAYYDARQARNRAEAAPFSERCMVPSCTNRAVPPYVHGWRRCTDHTQVAS